MIKKPLLMMVLAFTTSFGLYAQTEDCANGIDDDGDGLIDCLDPDCTGGPVPTGAFFNTATNGTGGVLPGGSNDLNWTVSTTGLTGTYSPAAVMTSPPGSYVVSPWADCAWISYVSSGIHSVDVDHYYKIRFYLPCVNTCGQSYSDPGIFCLAMDFFADNSVDAIYVNGTLQTGIAGVPSSSPYYGAGFVTGAGISISLCQDWQPGLNELVIKVSSGPGYTGFLAQNSTTTPPVLGDPTITAPTGSTTSVDFCSNAPTATFTAVSSGGTWSATCGTCINSSTGVFDPSVAGAGTHVITYSLTSPCPVSDTIVVNINAAGDPTITTPTTTLCTGSAPTTLTATTAGGTWSATCGTCINSITGVFNPTTGPGTYVVTYSIPACGVSDTATIHVSSIGITPVATDASCHNYPDGTVISNITGTGAPLTYAITGPLSGSNSTGTFNNLPPGNYTITVTNPSGCTGTSTFTVGNPAPVIAAFTADTYSGIPPLTVNFTNNSSNATGWWWDLGNGVTTTTTNPSTVYNTGNYQVMLVATNGVCNDTAYVNIEVDMPSFIIVPNVFTPNGDGANDELNLGYQNITEIDFKVFNRWGQLIFESSDVTKTWKGKDLGGQICAEGTYYFLLKARGGDDKAYEQHGHVTLFMK